MNLWNRSIFDALEKKDAGTVLTLSMIYFVILVVSVGFAVAQVYARMTLQRRWREWLTDNLVDRWLKSGRYYQLNLVSGDHKNPEYRIADDVRIATESPVDFVSGVTSAFLSAATFIVVLWTIGGALNLSHRRHATLHPRLPGHRGGALRGDRQRRDDADRPPLRHGLREEEPVRGRASLRADAAARERREHRADPGRGGGARRRRPLARQGAAGMALDLPPVHEDDDASRRAPASSRRCCRSSCARRNSSTAR